MGAVRVGVKGRSAAGMGWDRAGTNVASRRPRTENDTNRGERVRRARAARAGGLGARGWADQITKKGPWIDGLPVVARQDGAATDSGLIHIARRKIAIQKSLFKNVKPLFKKVTSLLKSRRIRTKTPIKTEKKSQNYQSPRLTKCAALSQDRPVGTTEFGIPPCTW